MSKLAHADVVVERASLRVPLKRRAIRFALYEALGNLGRVDAVDRYVVDPPDGPLREREATGDMDWDRFAVVRVIGRVTPLTR